MSDTNIKKSGLAARLLLISWANNQQNWVREIVQSVLGLRSPLPDQLLDKIYQNFLAETELTSATVARIPILKLQADQNDDVDPLTVTEMSDVKNVNRLASDQNILFNPRMTVLFGENATGKSGYVRILKQAAAVRSAEPILPDVHSPKKRAVQPKALIRYQLGDTDRTIDWTGQSGVKPLTRIGVFDSRALAFHLEEDLTYVYTPGDLALFEYVHAEGRGSTRRRGRSFWRSRWNYYVRIPVRCDVHIRS